MYKIIKEQNDSTVEYAMKLNLFRGNISAALCLGYSNFFLQWTTVNAETHK